MNVSNDILKLMLILWDANDEKWKMFTEDKQMSQRELVCGVPLVCSNNGTEGHAMDVAS